MHFTPKTHLQPPQIGIPILSWHLKQYNSFSFLRHRWSSSLLLNNTNVLVLIHTTVSVGKVRSEASTCGLLNFLLNLPDGYRSDFIFWGWGEGQGGRSLDISHSLCIEKSI